MSMSKIYETTYSFPVVFKNMPINKRLKNDAISIKTKISIKGWDLLTKKIKNRKVIIDLKNYPNENALNFSNTKSLASS